MNEKPNDDLNKNYDILVSMVKCKVNFVWAKNRVISLESHPQGYYD